MTNQHIESEYYDSVQAVVPLDDLVEATLDDANLEPGSHAHTEAWHENLRDIWRELVSTAKLCLPDEIALDGKDILIGRGDMASYAIGYSSMTDCEAFVLSSDKTPHPVLFVGFKEKTLDEVVDNRMYDIQLQREEEALLRGVYPPNLSDDEESAQRELMIRKVAEEMTAEMRSIADRWFDRLSTYYLIRTGLFSGAVSWRLRPESSWSEAPFDEVQRVREKMLAGDAVWGAGQIVHPEHPFLMGINNRAKLMVLDRSDGDDEYMPLVSARTQGELVTAIGTIATICNENDGATYYYGLNDCQPGDLYCLTGVALTVWRILRGEKPSRVLQAIAQREDPSEMMGVE